MTRHFHDWLQAYVDYTSYTEAPTHMHFWSGVSAVAGALRRRVWISQFEFEWYPNFYIILVAPPGVVAKSTTADIAMKLLRQVPGVKFGPDITSWPSLIEAFEESTEAFDIAQEWHVMSPLTLVSSEFGNLVDPNDRKLLNVLIDLWDGKSGKIKKRTKNAGQNEIENPWINLIACTTPTWIAENVQEHMLGGGFISRCIFVFADKKRKFVPYLDEAIPADIKKTREKLVEDLGRISLLAGEYRLSDDARRWGRCWYEQHSSAPHTHLEGERFGGYLARKQTHIHKLAMVLAAAARDELIITAEDLFTAHSMVTDLEEEMGKVFSHVGKSDVAMYAQRLVTFVAGRRSVPYTEAFRHVKTHFPKLREFEEVLDGCVKAGEIVKEHCTRTGSLILRVGPAAVK